MLDSTVILNARLPQQAGLYQIAIQAGKISTIKPSNTAALASETATQKLNTETAVGSATTIDVNGDWVTQGAVDLQINGALGLAFPDLRRDTLDQLQAICELLWEQGVNGFCPTLVTTSLENFHGSLSAIRAFQQQQASMSALNGAATVLGAHLEGPFLNTAKRGAHPAEHLQPLSLATVQQVVGAFADVISIMTLAPEQTTDDRVIPWLQAQGITVSLGHSLATATQAEKAFEQGATMVTHAFNAMPGLHHREPGLLGVALTDSRIFCGFIADGQHIGKTMLDVLLRTGRGTLNQNGKISLGGLFLVSDALSPLGLPDGTYPWDNRQIEVIQGTARLTDGTLSGTTRPLIEGAVNLVKWGLCDVEEAIALVTTAPRQAIGLPTTLQAKMPAAFIRWHQTDAGQLTWERLAID